MLVRRTNPLGKPALDLCLVRELPGYFTFVPRHLQLSVVCGSVPAYLNEC